MAEEATLECVRSEESFTAKCFEGRNRRRWRGGAGLSQHRQIPGCDLDALAEHLAVKDIFHEFALDFAKKVIDMTGGELKIEVLPAGAVVPAFQLLDAVSKGTLDGGHGVLSYHYGKQTALALWGSSPAYGMDANMILSWHKYGGGKELLIKIYNSLGANVVSFPYGPMPTQPLGWYKKPIHQGRRLQGYEVPHCRHLY